MYFYVFLLAYLLLCADDDDADNDACVHGGEAQTPPKDRLLRPLRSRFHDRRKYEGR